MPHADFALAIPEYHRGYEFQTFLSERARDWQTAHGLYAAACGFWNITCGTLGHWAIAHMTLH